MTFIYGAGEVDQQVRGDEEGGGVFKAHARRRSARLDLICFDTAGTRAEHALYSRNKLFQLLICLQYAY